MKLVLFDIDSTLLRDGGAAGRAFTIGVATGKNSREELSAAGADAVVPDLEDTATLLSLIDR